MGARELALPEWFKSTFKPGAFAASSAVFPPIDADKLAGQLGVAKAGAERGAVEQPPTDLVMLDEVEHRIVEAIDDHRRQGIQRYEEHCEVYQRRLSRAAEARQEIDVVAGRATTDFHAEVVVWDGHLANARKHLALADDAVNWFRGAHGLRRPAIAGTTGVKWAAIALMLLIAESVLNGVVFAEVNSNGLVGGVLVALMISVVNVGFMSFAGYFSRYANHRKFIPKLFGLVIGLAAVAFAVGFNLGVAHLRDAVEAARAANGGSEFAWNEAAQAGIRTLVSDPLAIHSAQSWLLFALGLLVSLVAAIKGFHLDDPYPGYGHLSRDSEKAHQDYADLVEEAVSTIVERRDSAVEELRDAQRLVARGISEAADALFGQSTLAAHMTGFLEHCEQKANHLLQRYREANRKARKTPPPAHFNEPYKAAELERGTAVRTRDDKALLKTSQQEVAKINERVDSAVKEIFTECDIAVKAFRSIDAITGTAPNATAGSALKAPAESVAGVTT